jgi:peptidoglycan/LPS O-acetylase OafA/YrhL
MRIVMLEPIGVAELADAPVARAAERPRLRLAYLDGLRALAALYVVAFHSMLGFSRASLVGRYRFLRALFGFGHEAVAVFIVLSGYCLMLPLVRERPERLEPAFGVFLRRRALRILPPYFAALFGSLVLIYAAAPLRAGNTGTIWDDSLPALELGPILSHVVLVHNWTPAFTNQINGPLWSVATEWQIYFCFPLLLLPVWRSFGMTGALGAAALLGYAPLLIAPHSAASAVSWYLVLFTFGMSAAATGFASDERRPLNAAWPWSVIAAASWAACGVFALGAATIWFRFKPITDVLVGFATAATLVYLTGRAATQARGVPLRLLESRPLVAIGHFSYSLYLTHLPVVALLWLALTPLGLSPFVSAWVLLGASTLASLAVAYVFHLAIERPSMAWR